MNKVVEDFHKKLSYSFENYNDNTYSDKIKVIESEIKSDNYDKLYRLSSVMKKIVKNLDFKDESVIHIIKNGLSKYTMDPYILSIIKPCFVSAIRFKRILEMNNMYDTYLIKEFLISFFVIILHIPLGKFENLALFESIQILWMIIDNAIDNKDFKHKKKLIKPIFKFLVNEIYEKDNKNAFLYKHKDNLCISIVIDIYKNKQLKNKKEFFRDVRKLLMYSYTQKGIHNETTAKSIDILHVSLEKSYLSSRLFKHCIFEDIIEDEKFYNLCLLSQLSDDIMDVTEDLVNNGNTIMTCGSRKERSLISLCVIEEIIEKFPEIKHYLIVSILDAVLYNKNLHDPKFIKEITKYNFINTSELDFQEIEEILFKEKIDMMLDENLLVLYDKETRYMDDDTLEMEIFSLADN